MLVRIVRMNFEPDKVANFVAHFQQIKERILAVEGCERLELWQDKDQPNFVMTCSHWQSADYLEKYRQSDLFLENWRVAKSFFADKATAFSSEILASLSK